MFISVIRHAVSPLDGGNQCSKYFFGSVQTLCPVKVHFVRTLKELVRHHAPTANVSIACCISALAIGVYLKKLEVFTLDVPSMNDAR